MRRLVLSVLAAAVVVVGGCAATATTGAAPAPTAASPTAASPTAASPTAASPTAASGTTASASTASVTAASGTAASVTAASGTAASLTTASATSPSAQAVSTTGAPAASPGLAQVDVPERLQFTATTLDGAPFDGADLAGKPAVFWFWAPWCPNCRAEAPQVAAAAAANPDVVFIGVAAQDDLPAMQSFVTDYGVGGFQHLADLDAAIWQRFGVTYQPAYAFVDADGSIDVVKSRVSADELDSRLSQLAG